MNMLLSIGDIVLFGNYKTNIITEIFGMIALIVVVFGYMGKTRKLFYFTQILANILLSSGFIIKGNWLAGIGIAIATMRSLTFLIFDIKNKDVPKYFVAIFLGLFVLNGYLNWTNMLDLLSIVALCTNTLFCQIKDQKTMKLCMILPVSLTIIYDIACVFISKTILKIIELVSIFVFFYKTKQKEKLQQNSLLKNTLSETNTDIDNLVVFNKNSADSSTNETYIKVEKEV